MYLLISFAKTSDVVFPIEGAISLFLFDNTRASIAMLALGSLSLSDTIATV